MLDVPWEWLVGVVAGGAVLWRPLAALWRLGRRTSRFLDVWEGVGDTPGVDERLRTVEGRTAQLERNGGGSVKDAVDRIDKQLREHITECRLPRWRR